MEILKCGSQKYAWGKLAHNSKVAKLQGEADKLDNKDVRFAELWIGVHNSAPSIVVGPNKLLKDFLAQNVKKYLGDEHIKFYKKPELPFLLKVLSIDMALSIQCHPTRAQAQKLHKDDPKHYPDPNHKPELICPLTEFEALCCFRSVKEILYFIHQSTPFQKLLGKQVVVRLMNVANDTVKPTSVAVKSALRFALEKLYDVPQQLLTKCVQQQISLIENKRLGNDKKLDVVHSVFVHTNKNFPNDVGLWMVYFLNYLQLKPGDALFLSACEPHAYLSGDGVEIMANSDNVVRAGLTPKFKDVKNLLNMLTYDTFALENARYAPDLSKSIQEYAPPSWCDDFSLFAFRLSKGNPKASYDLPSVGLGVCVEGEATCEGKKIKFGNEFVVPHGKVTFELAEGCEDCHIFVSTTNVHGAKKKSHL